LLDAIFIFQFDDIRIRRVFEHMLLDEPAAHSRIHRLFTYDMNVDEPT
jgi:hypothetical protein